MNVKAMLKGCVVAGFCLPSFLWAAQEVVIRPFSGDISISLLHAFFPIEDVGAPILIGVLMRLLNIGISSVVAVILGYLVFFGTIGSAIDANELGRKLQFWTGIRMVFGTLLLFPVHHGFSSLQSFILWMVMNGVGLADALWSEVMTLLVHEPTVVARSDAAYWQDLKVMMGLPTSTSAPAFVSALIGSELCLELKYHQARDPMLPSMGDVGLYALRVDQDCGPGFSGICYGHAQSPTLCGAYAVKPSQPGLSQALLATAYLVQQSIQPVFSDLAAQASLDLASGQMPTLSLSGCQVGEDPSQCTLSRTTLAAASSYLSGIEPLRIQSESVSHIESVLQQGWVVAGYYYTQLLGRTQKAPARIPLPDYFFPYQSTSVVSGQCQTQQAGYMYAYCHLDQETRSPKSQTRSQTQELYTQIYEATATVRSDPQHVNNMVNDPVVNYATALLIHDLIYRVSDDYFSAMEDPRLAGFSRWIIKAGAALTGSASSTAAVGVVNLMNLALCSAQAITGIVVYDQGCRFDAAHAPSSVHCSSQAVKEACALDGYDQCLRTAVDRGCISQTPGAMGMLGSFYYNQTNVVGENPMYTIAQVGWTFIQSALSSLMYNMQQGTQLVINAGVGLLSLKLPLTLSMQTLGATLQGVELQMGTGFTLMGLGGLTTLLDMGYQMVLYQVRFMSDALMILNTLLMGYGAIYAIYFPCVPMIIYTLGVVGWFGTVIEAMVAAPLIAAGVAYPQGGQFLGAAEQGLSLGFSVFLRPVLLVIGLYMSAVLAQIAMALTQYTCLYFIAFILGMFGVQSSFVNILVMFMISLIYLSVCFEVLSYVYTFITMLPDRIMRWFLAGSTESLTGQSVTQSLSFVRDQVHTAAEQMARAAPTPPRNIRMLDPQLLGRLVLDNPVGGMLVYGTAYAKKVSQEQMTKALGRMGEYRRDPEELSRDLKSAWTQMISGAASASQAVRSGLSAAGNYLDPRVWGASLGSRLGANYGALAPRLRETGARVYRVSQETSRYLTESLSSAWRFLASLWGRGP